MRTIVQVEYRSGLLTVREEILQFLGHPVVSVFGSLAARQLDLSDNDVGVILIGHGAPWEERSHLIAHFKRTLPGIPVIASLRQTDKRFSNADYNCPADNPPEWGSLGHPSTCGSPLTLDHQYQMQAFLKAGRVLRLPVNA